MCRRREERVCNTQRNQVEKIHNDLRISNSKDESENELSSSDTTCPSLTAVVFAPPVIVSILVVRLRTAECLSRGNAPRVITTITSTAVAHLLEVQVHYSFLGINPCLSYLC